MNQTEESIADHLERYLGPIQRGWSAKDDSSGIQVVQFVDRPVEGVMTVASLGLSSSSLKMATGTKVRQEFLLSINSEMNVDHLASFLITFAAYVKKQGNALLRGDIVGPSSPLVPGVRVNSIYASIPVFFNEEICTFKTTDPPTVLVSLLPLHGSEAIFVRKHGWEIFEDLLEKENPDLFDMNRSPLRKV